MTIEDLKRRATSQPINVPSAACTSGLHTDLGVRRVRAAGLLVLLGLALPPILWSQAAPSSEPTVPAAQVDQTPVASAPPAVPAEMMKIGALGAKFDKLDGICSTWNIGCPTAGDTIDRDLGGFRTALAKAHIGVLGVSSTIFGYNFAQPPQNPQVFNYEKPNWSSPNFLYATYNIPSQKIQFVAAAAFTRNNNSGISGPPVFRPLNAYVYQPLFSGRLSYMLGYINNDTTVYGGYIAGNLATGTLGVNAVIPYELGMSFSPFPAPNFNLKYTAKNGLYAVAVVQRSNDPGGNTVSKMRDKLAFRFDPRGDKALYIEEIGFKRPSSINAKEMWFRATGFYNLTGFANYRSLQTALHGPKEHNAGASVVFEQQLTQPDKALPYRGLYWTFTGQYALPDVNIYHQYYQAALYTIGPFRKRPLDIAILNLNRTQFSRTVLNTFQQLPPSPQTGVSTFDDSTSISGTYGYHLAPGVVLSTLFTYTKHPTFAPKLANPVTGVVSVTFFF